MKRKVLSTMLLAGALLVTPVGSKLMPMIASASGNNSTNSGFTNNKISSSSNNTANSWNNASSGNTSNNTSSSSNNTVNPGNNSSSGNTSNSSSNNTVNPGNNSSSGNTSNNSYSDTVSDFEAKLDGAKSGDTIELNGITTLSKNEMDQVTRKNVTLVMRYNYLGVDYVVTIPAGVTLDQNVPYYGPLYLASRFKTGAGSTANTTTNNTASYTVKKGDTIGKIARANGMTVAQLSALNPQIKDLNRISIGQKINLK